MLKKILFLAAVVILATGLSLAQDTSNVRSIGVWPYGPTETMAYYTTGGVDYALFGSGRTLVIANVNTPTSPSKAGQIVLSNEILDIAVSGNYAYVANYDSGLCIIDISDPANPVKTGRYPGLAQEVAVSGYYAYVGGSGLHIVDVSDPSNPYQTGYRNVSYWSWSGIDVADTMVYMSFYSISTGGGLMAFNVADPASPESVGTWYKTLTYCQDVTVSGNYAYVAAGDSGLRVIDISNPASLAQAGYLATNRFCYSLAKSGDYIWLCNGIDGLIAADVSTPTMPDNAGYNYADVSGNAKAVAVGGDGYHLYVADDAYGLRVINGALQDVPWQDGSLRLPGRANDVAVAGDHAFMVYQDHGLEVMDISDPSNPAPVAFYALSADTMGIKIYGDYAYIPAQEYGFYIFDISNPLNPVKLCQFSPSNFGYGSSAMDIVVQGNYAYLADGGKGLAIVDVSNPSSPDSVAYHNTIGSGYGVDVSGNYAYVADGAQKLRVIDVSTPAAPFEAGFWSGTELMGLTKVRIAGSRAYISDGDKLGVLDISVPTTPVLDTVIDPPGRISDILISGGYIYLTTGSVNQGLRIISISNMAEVARYIYPDVYDNVNAVDVSGSYVLLTSSNHDELRICQYYGPQNPSLLTPANNAWLASDTAFCTWSAVSKKAKDSPVYYVLKAYSLPDTINPTAVDTTDLTADTLVVFAGRYRWLVEAHDEAGNPPGISGYYNFGYDKTPPSAIVQISPADSLTTNQDSITFCWHPSTDAVSGIREYALVYAHDVGFSTGVAETTLIDTSITLVLPDTAYYWMVEARDTAGNVGVSYVWHLNVDTRNPDIPTLALPIGWTGDTTVVFSWSEVAKKIKGSAVEYVIQIDTITAFTAPVIEDTTSSLSDTFNLMERQYYWRVMAYDLAGNYGTYSGYMSFGVDTTAPDIQYVMDLPDDASVPYGPYEVSSKVYDLSLKSAWLFTQVNGGSWDSTAMFSALDSLRDTIPALSPSTDETLTVSYYVKVWDMPDHQSTSATYSFKAIGPLGVEGNPGNSVPSVFALNGAYPNPSRGQTAIKYQLPNACNVSLTIYNVAGQAVKRFDLGTMPAGYHTVNWNGNRMAAGVYFYRLQAGSFSSTKKLMIVR